jgi:hypothetical protein
MTRSKIAPGIEVALFLAAFRDMPPKQLAKGVFEARKAADDPTDPYHFTEADWLAIDRLRATLPKEIEP